MEKEKSKKSQKITDSGKEFWITKRTKELEEDAPENEKRFFEKLSSALPYAKFRQVVYKTIKSLDNASGVFLKNYSKKYRLSVEICKGMMDEEQEKRYSAIKNSGYHLIYMWPSDLNSDDLMEAMIRKVKAYMDTVDRKRDNMESCITCQYYEKNPHCLVCDFFPKLEIPINCCEHYKRTKDAAERIKEVARKRREQKKESAIRRRIAKEEGVRLVKNPGTVPLCRNCANCVQIKNSGNLLCKERRSLVSGEFKACSNWVDRETGKTFAAYLKPIEQPVEVMEDNNETAAPPIHVQTRGARPGSIRKTKGY